MNEIVEYLRVYALKVVELYGKMKSHEFLEQLEKIYVGSGNNHEWFIANKFNISIAANKLIQVAVSDWLKKQYDMYPFKTVRENNIVVSGKVSDVESISASSMHTLSQQIGWSMWTNTGMRSGKKLQVIHLHDEIEPYYVTWSKEAIGVRQYNIVDFKWENKNGFRVLIKNTIEGHGEGFGGSKPITINSIHYPSIKSAYSRIQPAVSYSTICTRLRKNMSPEDAFYLSNQRADSDINKLGVIVKKDPWVRTNQKIS
ncbi:TPA: hypothetical protein ACMDTS_003481 [Vibrio cholerae]|uniref:hypothetical protein n=1 Tax=Vibrio mimicus TaxID=674 RepID=UPI002FEF816E